mgnify:CR=1 FL=1
MIISAINPSSASVRLPVERFRILNELMMTELKETEIKRKISKYEIFIGF